MLILEAMSPPASLTRNFGRSRPERLDPEDERGRLRLHFIHRYVRDERFAHALRRLARTHGDVAAFCRRWGLTFHDHQAETAVREWCEQRRQNGGIPSSALLTYFSWGGFKPTNHGLIRLRFVWDPTEESRADAEAHLRGTLERRMQAALDDIARAYRCFDKPSRQRRPARGKHLNWLFERQCHGLTYEEIAERATMVEADAVRQACQRLAKRMELELRKSSGARS